MPIGKISVHLAQMNCTLDNIHWTSVYIYWTHNNFNWTHVVVEVLPRLNTNLFVNGHVKFRRVKEAPRSGARAVSHEVAAGNHLQLLEGAPSPVKCEGHRLRDGRGKLSQHVLIHLHAGAGQPWDVH